MNVITLDIQAQEPELDVTNDIVKPVLKLVGYLAAASAGISTFVLVVKAVWTIVAGLASILTIAAQTAIAAYVTIAIIKLLASHEK